VLFFNSRYVIFTSVNHGGQRQGNRDEGVWPSGGG
jgi:hypothetical protein